MAMHWKELPGGAAVPCSLMEWAEAFENAKARSVGFWNSDAFSQCVSTVFLGLNHNYGLGPPLIYETAIFVKKHGRPEFEQLWRYSTREAAEEGHRRIVEAIQAGKDLNELDVKP
jgi:hypothetical protein